MRKKISTLFGIVIIVAVVIVFFGGVFAYEYFLPKEFKIVPTNNISKISANEKALLGDWEKESNETVDQNCGPDNYQFSFYIENGQNKYDSWWNCHPADSGIWVLDGNTLTMYMSYGIDIDGNNIDIQENIKINGDTLTLGDMGDFKKIIENKK